jgi:hypothetical protein
MKKNTAKIQNRNQNSHAASQYGVGEAEPSFEYKDSRLQTLLDLAHDGDEIAQAEIETLIFLIRENATKKTETRKGTKKMKKTTKSNRKTTTKKKEEKTMNQQEQKFTDAQVARARKNREELAKTSEKFREFLETNRAARRAEYKGATGQQVAEIVASVPLKYLGCNSLNDFLKVDYREQTGAETFATFEQWKAQGKSVKKGERGFPIWSEPRKVEVKTETGMQTVTRYSLAYIFHEGQVRENEKTATANA